MNEESKFPIMEERIMDDVFAEEKTRWIPVTERLPDEDGRYLVFRQNNGKIFIDSWMVGRGWLFFETVAAWMPLPKPFAK